MKKARALTILMSVCLLCGFGLAASPAGAGRATEQAPTITPKPDLTIGAAEGNDKFVRGVDPNFRMGGTWGMALNMITVTNSGTRSLFGDVVIGYGREADKR